MRQRRFITALLLFVLCALEVSLAQFNINTVAGGGPNNLAAAQASVGFPQSVAVDAAGNVYIADAYSSHVFEVSTSGTLTIVAGNGSMGFSGDGGPATAAALNTPESVAVDSAGNIFIADTYNSVIREVSASNGNIQTVAGNFSAGEGYSGDGSPATSAQLNHPFGIAVDGQGNLFIADTDNNVIREVSAASGNIQTIAGNYSAGAGYSGDGSAATSAQLQGPEGVFADASGNVFVADTLNSVIREVAIANGNIQTVAGAYYNAAGGTACQFTGDGGSATSAYLCLPASILVDASQNLYIADTANYAIREVVSGNISTVAGTLGSYGYSGDGGAATSALLQYPGGMALDGSGNLFVADTDNSVVREVTAGQIQAFAGNTTLAYSGDGGPALQASLSFPGGVFVDASGNIFIADTNNSVIREVVASTGVIQTVAGNGTLCALPAPGGCGDGGPAASAQLNFPYGVFVDSAGNIYIAETGLPGSENSVIRVVNTGTAAIAILGTTINPGEIQTVVGTLGTAGFAGDGGPPLSAQLSNPQAVTLDAAGNVYIADSGNSAIRVVNAGSQPLVIGNVSIAPGAIATVAGMPPIACADPSSGCGDNAAASSAFLNFPTGIAVDAAQNIYVADSQNSAIRVINPSTQNSETIAGATIPPGDILTVAGVLGQLGYSGDNGAPNAALLNTPYGVYVDSLGNIYISDAENSAVRLVVSVAGTIQTIAGNGTAGFSGDGGAATSAQLNVPQSVLADASGNIFFADSQNSRIRKLTSSVGISIVPPSATVPVGLTQQFLASVTGSGNANVTWQVNGVTNGNSTVGTISSAGLYQAPATVPASAITVTAISDANGITSATASVTLAASGAPGISVSTTPAGTSVVYTSMTLAFTATVSGESNTAVNWSVNGVAGGNSTVGTIDTNGNYTAPAAVPSPAVVVISAVSQADATVSGSYPLDIVTAPAVSAPAAQTIGPGGTASFALALAAGTGSPQHPITLSCLQSSLPSGATCTFSPSTITPSSSAVSFSLAVTVAKTLDKTAASIQPPYTTWLAAEISFSLAPIAGIVLLSTKRKRIRRRALGLFLMSLLLLTVACGGNAGSSSSGNTPPQTYNIQVQGTTAAQPQPITLTTVSLTVQ